MKIEKEKMLYLGLAERVTPPALPRGLKPQRASAAVDEIEADDSKIFKNIIFLLSFL